MFHIGIRGKLVIPLLVCGAAVVAVAYQQLTQAAHGQALDSTSRAAKTIAKQISTLRGYYTEHVVAVAKAKGITVSHNHDDHHDQIPLPATMVHELNELLSESEGFSVRLFSAHPFPFRKEGGIHDAFEQEAWDTLRHDASAPFSRVEDVNGAPALRYAVADIMTKKACVDCHNSRADSPVTGWKLGDVRGVLEITVPLTTAHQAASRAAQQACWLLGATILAGIGSCILLANRLVVKPVREMASSASRLAQGDVGQCLVFSSHDEIGVLSASLKTVDDTLIRLKQETSQLADAAERCDFSVRVQSQDFSGCYREMLDGINRNLDAFATPTREAVDVMQAMAQGDLRQRMSVQHTGEFNVLADGMNRALTQLNSAISEVAHSGTELESVARKMCQASHENATGCREQACSLEEIAASLEEMSAMTKQSADNAGQANSLASESAQQVQQGLIVMNQMESAISRIKKSADEQAKILKTIDEIAFQTNLLALNAAVEAARAGDAGRGFAVVADEVRRLAQRSADAARVTSEMIQQTIANVDTGVVMTSQVSQTLQQISGSAQRTTVLVNEISASSREQAQGIAQVSSAVGELDRNTQAISQRSQTAATMAEELNDVVEQLANTVRRFEIGEPQAHVCEEILKADVDSIMAEIQGSVRPATSNRLKAMVSMP